MIQARPWRSRLCRDPLPACFTTLFCLSYISPHYSHLREAASLPTHCPHSLVPLESRVRALPPPLDDTPLPASQRVTPPSPPSSLAPRTPYSSCRRLTSSPCPARTAAGTSRVDLDLTQKRVHHARLPPPPRLEGSARRVGLTPPLPRRRPHTMWNLSAVGRMMHHHELRNSSVVIQARPWRSRLCRDPLTACFTTLFYLSYLSPHYSHLREPSASPPHRRHNLFPLQARVRSLPPPSKLPPHPSPCLSPRSSALAPLVSRAANAVLFMSPSHLATPPLTAYRRRQPRSPRPSNGTRP